MLEQYLDDLCEGVTTGKWHADGMTADQLSRAADAMFYKIKSTGLQPSLFAVLHKPGNSEVKEINDDWKLLQYKGDEASRELITEFLQGLALRYFRGPTPLHDSIMQRAGKILGTSIEFKHFFNDAYARIIEIKRDGRDGYLYWQPLVIRNPARLDLAKTDFSSKVLRENVPDNDAAQVAVVLFQIFKEDAHRQHLNIIKQVLNNESVRFAITRKGDSPYVSSGFPLAAVPLSGDHAAAVPGWLIKDVSLTIGAVDYRFFIAAGTLSESRTTARAG
jgi:hypothetical protein